MCGYRLYTKFSVIDGGRVSLTSVMWRGETDGGIAASARFAKESQVVKLIYRNHRLWTAIQKTYIAMECYNLSCLLNVSWLGTGWPRVANLRFFRLEKIKPHSFPHRRSLFSKTRLSTMARIVLLNGSRAWYGPLVLCTTGVVKGRLLPVLQVR